MFPSNIICFNPSTMPTGIKLQYEGLESLSSNTDLIYGIPDTFVEVKDLSEHPVFNADDCIYLGTNTFESKLFQKFKVLEDYTILSKAFNKYLNYVTLYFKDGESRTFYSNTQDNIYEAISTFKFVVEFDYKIKDEFKLGELKAEDEVALDLIGEHLINLVETS